MNQFKKDRFTIFILIVILLAIILPLTIKIARFKEILTLVFTLVLYILPGLIIGTSIFNSNIKNYPDTIIFSIILGITLSSLITALIGFFIKWEIYLISLFLISFSSFIYFLFSKFKVHPLQFNSPKWTNKDYQIILFFSIILSLIVILPFVNTGKMTKNGVAFTYLLKHDFTLHVNHTACLSRGIPPKYFHYAGENLHYFWLAFVLPAFTYTFNQKNFSLINIMILTQLFYSFLFLGVIFCLYRVIIKNKKILFLMMLLTLCAYSFNDLYVFVKVLITKSKFISSWLPTSIVNPLFSFSNLSQGFYRFYILEAQTLFSFCLLSLCFYLIYLYWYNDSKPWVLILISFLSGVTFGVETITGILLFGVFISFMLMEVIKIIRKKNNILQKRNSLLTIVISLIIFFIIYKLFFVIQMFSNTQQQSISLGVNKFILATLPFYLLIAFGPASVFGIAGIINKIKNKQIFYYYPFLSLFILSITMVIFLKLSNTKIIDDTTMIVKGGRTVLFSLIIFSGLFFDKAKSKIIYKTFIIMIIMAIPTLLIDIHTLSNVRNTQNTYIKQADINATLWIKNNIPQDSIIQAFSNDSAFSIVTFGEKQMVLGQKFAYRMLHDDLNHIEEREQKIIHLFKSKDIQESIKYLKKYIINYIYLGIRDKERLTNEELSKFYSYSDIFKNIYSKNNVDIFHVNPTIFQDSKGKM